MHNEITIEALEALLESLVAEEAADRAKLQRLLDACARIVNLRQPEKFPRKPLEHSDEDGHWDNSFPPAKKFKDFAGPRLLKVEAWETEDIATSGGYYHDWRRVTTDRGLYVAPDGTLWGCDETGTGSIGQYAARPGDCNVECTLDWSPLEEVTADQIREAVKAVSALAFPLATAAQARREV